MKQDLAKHQLYIVVIPQVFIPKDLPLVIQITEYWRKGNVWIFRRLLYTEHVNSMLLPGTQSTLKALLLQQGYIWGRIGKKWSLVSET